MDMKRIFLISLVVSLCLCALTGIIIFLMGNFGDVEVRILLTTLTIGLYSLSGLCCATLLENENGRLRVFSITGIIIAFIGVVYCLSAIWGIILGDVSLKTLLVLIVLPAFFAHVSLMLLIKNKTKLVQISLMLTIIMSAILTTMLLILTFEVSGDFYSRLLGVVSILVSLGTIVTPVLNKIHKEV